MILVDTSVWIDHLRGSEPQLRKLLDTGKVLVHSMIIGELACGNLPDRENFLRRMNDLPAIDESDRQDVLSMIDAKGLMGRGIGYVDVNLICSVLRRKDTAIWTRDRRLNAVAKDLGIAYSVSP